MSIKTQEILHKINLLPQELQEEVINYLNFLIHKYDIQPSNEKLQEVIPKAEPSEIVQEKETTLQKEDKQNPETKKDEPSTEDLQLDEEIQTIEEKKQDKLSPDWQDLKQAFKDEFF